MSAYVEIGNVAMFAKFNAMFAMFNLAMFAKFNLEVNLANIDKLFELANS